jgi:hypothetical protein
MRELKPNSEVAKFDGKKTLTWLATLATLSPGKRAAADEVWSGCRLLVTLRLSTLDFST